MKNGLAVVDTGTIFSLALVNQLDLLPALFDDLKLAFFVWEDITDEDAFESNARIRDFLKSKVVALNGYKELTSMMDEGEAQTIVLCQDCKADFLLTDDKKLRIYAERMGIKCVGTIALLLSAKEKGLINNLKPVFEMLLVNKRNYTIELLNKILLQNGEKIINII